MNELNELEVLETTDVEDEGTEAIGELEALDSDNYSEETSNGNYKYLVGGAIGSLVTVAAVKGYQKFIRPKASKTVDGLKKKIKSRKSKKHGDVIDAEVVEETEED